MPLVLTIKDGDKLQIGSATVVITRRSHGSSSVSITAPRDVPVRRPGVTDKRVSAALAPTESPLPSPTQEAA